MTSKMYSTWASGGNARIATPSTELFENGWTAVQPAYEHFNWLFNRIDKRLGELESPLEQNYVVSDSRNYDYGAGMTLTVPPYIKGRSCLKVYLDGVLCRNGEHYEELDNDMGSNYSTKIKFLTYVPRFVVIEVYALIDSQNTVPVDVRYGTETIQVQFAEQVITMDPESVKTTVIYTNQDITIKAGNILDGYVKRQLLVINSSDTTGTNNEHDITFLNIENPATQNGVMKIATGEQIVGELIYLNGKTFFNKLYSGARVNG